MFWGGGGGGGGWFPVSYLVIVFNVRFVPQVYKCLTSYRFTQTNSGIDIQRNSFLTLHQRSCVMFHLRHEHVAWKSTGSNISCRLETDLTGRIPADKLRRCRLTLIHEDLSYKRFVCRAFVRLFFVLFFSFVCLFLFLFFRIFCGIKFKPRRGDGF